MMNAFEQGGIVMYPLLLVSLGILWLAGRTAWVLTREHRSPADVERPLQGVLFWGVFSVVLGLLGTTIGIIQMAQAVVLAGQAEGTLLWGGLGVSLVTLIFGLLVFLVAAVLWFVLRQWAWHRFGDVRAGAPAV